MELEEYRQPWENGYHWEVKKQFLQFYKDFFPEDKLLCLAQVYSNIELLQCSYPTEVMSQIQKLARHLKACKRVPMSKYTDSKQNGKRKIEEPEPIDMKKQRESEEKEKHESEEEKQECLPPGLDSVDYKALIQSENFDILEKLNAEVQKLLKLQKENAFDLILSAALHLNIEDLIDFKYTQHSTREADSELVKYYCEFFIGTTKLAIGSGENRYIAKKNASENVLNTLSNLSLIQKLGMEVKKLLDAGNGDTAFDLMLRAALYLGMENLFNLKFTTRTLHGTKADYTYTRNCCEFFIGATKITEGIGNTKYAAKKKAANNAVYIITHLKDLPSGNVEHVRVQWNKKIDILAIKRTPKPSHGKWDKELLEKMAFEMKREAIKMQSVLSSVYASFTRIGRVDDLVYNAYKDLSDPKGGQDVFTCDALVNNVPMASGKGLSKKKARVVAAENLMKFFLDLFERKRKSSDASEDVYTDVLRLIDEHSQKTPLTNLKHISINDRTRTVEIIKSNIIPSASFSPLPLSKVKTVEKTNDKVPENEVKSSMNSLSVNKRLYENSIKQNLLLFDRSEIPGDYQKTHCSDLSYSVHRCRRIITCNYLPQINDAYRVEILLDHKVIGTGIASNRYTAKNEAARLIMEKLRKDLYTIKVKGNEDDEMFEIKPSDLIHLKFDKSKSASETRASSKKRPSSYGSVKRKEETDKIICSGNKDFTRFFKYYADLNGGADLTNLKTKLETLLRGYSKSDVFVPLKFSDKFLTSERSLIYKIGRKYGLVRNKYQKKEDKSIYLRRRISVKEFLDNLIKSGGRTSIYELADMSN